MIRGIDKLYVCLPSHGQAIQQQIQGQKSLIRLEMWAHDTSGTSDLLIPVVQLYIIIYINYIELCSIVLCMGKSAGKSGLSNYKGFL